MNNLVKRAQRGDADAFTELMQSQMQNMYKAARAILNNDEDVADAVADTLLVCWEKIEQLRKVEFFRTWMTKILINKCNDILRKKKELHYDDELQEFPEETQEYNNVEWMEVMKCLDEKYRLVMILYYVNGLTTAQISEVLNMPASTVRTRLARGREQIAIVYQIGEKRNGNRNVSEAANGGRI
ncbi:MAG: RNA polymerase sigma factor [Lachnospiraceae bacterium]|nr:RNA polymerase sigma factor [Lachnospiraceae bacterium]